jgi:hypothetical protein
VAEKWAQKCAKLEKGASGFIFEATQEYAAKYAEGLSYEAIAKEVTAAGFPISPDAVSDRLKALARVEGLGASRREGAFAEAYRSINAEERGSPGGKTGQLPKNHQGRLLVLQDVVKALVKDNDEDPEELADLIAGEARAAQRAARPAKAGPEAKRVRVDENYEIFAQVLDLLEGVEPPLSKRAQTKYDQAFLKFQVIGEEVEVR